MESMTSIQVSTNSKDLWSTLKNHSGESFEAMVNRLINTLNEDDSDLLTDKDISEIEQSIQDIKEGKFMTNAQLMKKHGL